MERLAQKTLDDFPALFREKMGRVIVRIADAADDKVLNDLGIDDPYELTGLYVGVPLTLDSATSPALHIPEVWLYRRPILDEWAARGDVSLGELVAHVLIHEIGHHFGWSDEDMDAALADAD